MSASKLTEQLREEKKALDRNIKFWEKAQRHVLTCDLKLSECGLCQIFWEKLNGTQ